MNGGLLSKEVVPSGDVTVSFCKARWLVFV